MAEREQTEQMDVAGNKHLANTSPYLGIPRWLKLSAIIVIILILLFGILHLTGNHNMRPEMHMPATAQGTLQP